MLDESEHEESIKCSACKLNGLNPSNSRKKTEEMMEKMLKKIEQLEKTVASLTGCSPEAGEEPVAASIKKKRNRNKKARLCARASAIAQAEEIKNKTVKKSEIPEVEKSEAEAVLSSKLTQTKEVHTSPNFVPLLDPRRRYNSENRVIQRGDVVQSVYVPRLPIVRAGPSPAVSIFRGDVGWIQSSRKGSQM